MELPARATAPVALHGGGKGTHLYAQPWNPIRSTFRSAVGDGIDYWFFYGPDLEEVIAGYRQATGAAPLWPQWAQRFLIKGTASLSGPLRLAGIRDFWLPAAPCPA